MQARPPARVVMNIECGIPTTVGSATGNGKIRTGSLFLLGHSGRAGIH